MSNKIFDCITFFDNNFMFNLRYNILKDYVDYFVVCESIYDHRGKPKKKILFKIMNMILKKLNTLFWKNHSLKIIAFGITRHCKENFY